MAQQNHITHFTRAHDGDGASAISMVFESIYTDLEHVARGLMRHERAGHTLGTSGVLHESYERLLRTYGGDPRARSMDRDELRAITARIMRRVLVDYARSRRARLNADAGHSACVARGAEEIAPMVVDLIALDEALNELAAMDKEKASIVELRFFGGMTMAKISAMLGRPLRSVERDWAFARAWLGMKVVGGVEDE